jgi:hypothetical protein
MGAVEDPALFGLMRPTPVRRALFRPGCDVVAYARAWPRRHRDHEILGFGRKRHMAPGRSFFRSALFAFAVVGLSAAPMLITAGCSSNGDDEWREDRRDRKESREERRERKKLERVLEQQKQ